MTTRSWLRLVFVFARWSWSNHREAVEYLTVVIRTGREPLDCCDGWQTMQQLWVKYIVRLDPSLAPRPPPKDLDEAWREMQKREGHV
jgi:hypothetical protein